MANPVQSLPGTLLDPRLVVQERRIQPPSVRTEKEVRPDTGQHSVESRSPVDRVPNETQGTPSPVVIVTEQSAISDVVDGHSGIAKGNMPSIPMPGADQLELRTASELIVRDSSVSAPEKSMSQEPSPQVLKLYKQHAPAFEVAEQAITSLATTGHPDAQKALLGLCHLEFMLHRSIERGLPHSAFDIGQRLYNLSHEVLNVSSVMSASSHEEQETPQLSAFSSKPESQSSKMSFASVPVLDSRPRYSVGEANFSLTRARVEGGSDIRPGTKATSYEQLDKLRQDYKTKEKDPDTSRNGFKVDVSLKIIQRAGVETAHGVDATDFVRSSSPRLTDCLEFTFPHEGSTKNDLIIATQHALNQQAIGGVLTAQDQRALSDPALTRAVKLRVTRDALPKQSANAALTPLETNLLGDHDLVSNVRNKRELSAEKAAENLIVERNQQLLDAFFQSAHNKVAPGGTIEVTLKTSPPYDKWDVVGMAEKRGWEFSPDKSHDFISPPGYTHARTTTTARSSVDGGSAAFPDTTFVFVRQGESRN